MVQLRTRSTTLHLHLHCPTKRRRLDWMVTAMYILEISGWPCQTATLTIRWMSSNSTVRWAPLLISQLSRQQWLRSPPKMMASMGWCPWIVYFRIISGIASLCQVISDLLRTCLTYSTDSSSSRLFQYRGGTEWWFRVRCGREWNNHTSLGRNTYWFSSQFAIAWRPDLKWIYTVRSLWWYDKNCFMTSIGSVHLLGGREGYCYFPFICYFCIMKVYL